MRLNRIDVVHGGAFFRSQRVENAFAIAIGPCGLRSVGGLARAVFGHFSFDESGFFGVAEPRFVGFEFALELKFILDDFLVGSVAVVASAG